MYQYLLEYSNGLSRVVFSREPDLLKFDYSGIPQEGLISIARFDRLRDVRDSEGSIQEEGT